MNLLIINYPKKTSFKKKSLKFKMTFNFVAVQSLTVISTKCIG